MTKNRPRGSKLRLNARLIREKDRARALELRKMLLFGAAIVIPLLGYVWQRVEFIRANRDLTALQNQKEDLEASNKQMTIERAMLLAPQRIEQVAREQLGLIDPPPENVRRVRIIDGSVRPAGDAVARRHSAERRAGRLVAATVGGLPIPAPREDRP
jgi:cell division protein FtsL